MRNKGFTLVELLIVIAIIGVLGGIVIGSISFSRSKAQDGRRAADMREIQIALALYYDVNKVYPADLSTLAANDQRFLPSIPKDPQTGEEYDYLVVAGNKDYCIGVTFDGDKPSDLPESASCNLSPGATANYKAQPLR